MVKNVINYLYSKNTGTINAKIHTMEMEQIIFLKILNGTKRRPSRLSLRSNSKSNSESKSISTSTLKSKSNRSTSTMKSCKSKRKSGGDSGRGVSRVTSLISLLYLLPLLLNFKGCYCDSVWTPEREGLAYSVTVPAVSRETDTGKSNGIFFDSTSAKDLIIPNSLRKSDNDMYKAVSGACPQGPVITLVDRRKSHSRGYDYGQGQSQSQSGGEGGKFYLEDEHGKSFAVSYEPHEKTISLSCWGNEPVTWNYHGTFATKIESTTLSRSVLDARNSSTFCYNAVIHVTIPRNRNRFTGTGNYTCTKINPPSPDDKHRSTHDYSSSRISSIYLYGNDKDGPYLLKPSSPINVILSTEKKDGVILTLPCPVNNPFVKPLLFKDNSKGEFELLDSKTLPKTTQNITYNPKTGFEISADSKSSDLSQLQRRFKCQMENSSQDFVLVNVQTGNTTENVPKRNDNLEISFKDYGDCASFICGHRRNTIFSEKSQEKVEISFIPCENPMHCNLLVSTTIQQKLDFSKTRSIHNDDACTAERDIPINGASTEAFHSGEGSSGILNSGIVVCRTKDRNLFQTMEFFPPISIEARRLKGDSEEEMEMEAQQFFNNTVKKLMSYSEWEEWSKSTSLTSSQFSPVIHIDLGNQTFYVNERVELSCTGSSFVFSHGITWLHKLKNGSVIPASLDDSVMLVEESSRGFLTRKSRLNITTSDISSIICSAPVWNSSLWQQTVFPVRVVDGTKPTIVHVTGKEVIFYDGDVNKTIECEANGIPLPYILWYKGELPFVDDTQNAWPHVDRVSKEHENVTVGQITFNKVSYESTTVGGLYVCNATNAKGTTLQSIYVTVKSTSPWKIWTWVLGIIFLCMVSVLGFFLRKYYRKSASQEEYIRQLSANEIEEFKFGRKQTLLNASLRGVGENIVNDGRELALYHPWDESFEVNENDLILDDDPVNRKLGEGNYGIVLRGTLFQKKTSSSVPVAVKMLKSWRTVQAKALLSELKILTYVGKHPNVVSLVGAITNISQQKIQVIIEYCAQGSLETFLREKRGVFFNEIDGDTGAISFTPNSITGTTAGVSSDYVKIDYAIKTIDLITWAYQFACGMEHLASRKIIHGDLAARNLLLTETRELKITDFGLSKKLANYTEDYIPTDPSFEQKGQPWRSLALEYWFGQKKFSTFSDVWAYGITLWEIFSLAEVPYPEFPCYSIDFVNSLAAGRRMEKPNYADSQIYEIMKRCWQEDPYKRPTFTLLTDWFLNMLPGNYASSIGSNAYRERSPIIPENPVNLEYIYADELEQFQFQDC